MLVTANLKRKVKINRRAILFTLTICSVTRHATVASTRNMGAGCGKEPEKYPEVDHSLKPIKAPKGGMTKEEMEAAQNDPEMAKKLAARAAESS